MDSRVQHRALLLYSLPTAPLLCSLATSHFRIPIGQKVQLNAWYDGNEMRSAICVDAQISIEWPHCPFPKTVQGVYIYLFI